MSKLNGVYICPTGIGLKKAGDAAFNPGVKLLAKCTENLIVNPNSVNASDIMELPENGWYTEGSCIDRFLEGEINLQKPKTQNKILMIVNSPVMPVNINGMNQGIWGLGANIEVLGLNTPLRMKTKINSDGSAGGEFTGADELIEQVKNCRKNFDCIALHTFIECPADVASYYFSNGGVNPWGAVEAIVSKYLSNALNKQVVHAPSENESTKVYTRLAVQPHMAPEIVSNCFLFCILKGLHRAPRLVNRGIFGGNVLRNEDIDFLVTPHGCWGRPHEAACKLGIPIIVVEEDTTIFSDGFEYPSYKNLIFVKNYLECAGLLQCMNAGIDHHLIL
ncbi:Uncharacterised protein [uncultured archaeon]|nr:Uncharacterised protein [uncultured archaeon]